MTSSNSTNATPNGAASEKFFSFWAICLAIWNSLTPEEIQAWQDYAESLDESLSAFLGFVIVAAADKPAQPSKMPPSD